MQGVKANSMTCLQPSDGKQLVSIQNPIETRELGYKVGFLRHFLPLKRGRV